MRCFVTGWFWGAAESKVSGEPAVLTGCEERKGDQSMTSQQFRKANDFRS